MPTISDGFEGFSDLILSVVLTCCPPMMRSYSRPSWPRGGFQGCHGKSFQECFFKSCRWVFDLIDILHLAVGASLVVQSRLLGQLHSENPELRCKGFDQLVSLSQARLLF